MILSETGEGKKKDEERKTWEKRIVSIILSNGSITEETFSIRDRTFGVVGLVRKR